MSIDMDFDAHELEQLVDDIREAEIRTPERARDAVEKNMDDVVDTAQSLAPVRDPLPFDPRKAPPGVLKDSIGGDLDSDGMGYEAGPTADYGAHVEFGTQAHPIRMRPGGPRLAWPTMSGAWASAGEVQHPGTSPQPYMIPAFETHIDDLVDDFGDIGERAL